VFLIIITISIVSSTLLVQWERDPHLDEGGRGFDSLLFFLFCSSHHTKGTHNKYGAEGALEELDGAERWTRSDGDCHQIDDIESTGTAEELTEEELSREEGG